MSPVWASAMTLLRVPIRIETATTDAPSDNRAKGSRRLPGGRLRPAAAGMQTDVLHGCPALRCNARRDGGTATWIFLPSLGLTLIAGLLATALNRGHHGAGWAWAKLLSGVAVFEWGFAAIQGPMQQEAELSARVLAHEVRPFLPQRWTPNGNRSG